MVCSASQFTLSSASKLAAAIATLAMSFAAIPARADLWNVYGGVSLETEYSDNKRLSTRDPDDGFQSVADLDVTAARVTRTNSLAAKAQLEAVRYDGIELLNDEENFSFRLSGEHKASRKVALGWYGQYARDTTSNRQPRPGSQVSEDSAFNIDTGLTREQFRTKELSFGPNITWRVSEKVKLLAAYSYRDVRFPERATTDFNFFDFDQHAVQLQSSYALDNRHSLSIAAKAARFDSSQRFEDGALNFVVGDVETESLGAALGYRYDIAQNIYLGVSAGVESLKTTTDFGELDSDNTEFVYRVFAVRRDDKNRLLLSFGRSVEPSGVGRLLESTLGRIVYTYRLSPRQTLRLRASYLSNKPIGNAADRLDREFFAFEPGYIYDLNRQLSLGVNYRFRTRELRVEGAEADNHAVSASVKYSFGQQ